MDLRDRGLLTPASVCKATPNPLTSKPHQFGLFAETRVESILGGQTPNPVLCIRQALASGGTAPMRLVRLALIFLCPRRNYRPA